MGTGARTGVVVPYSDNPERIGYALRELAQVHDPRSLLPGEKLHRDGKVPGDNIVDGLFDPGDQLLRRSLRQLIVTLGLLSLDVSVSGPGAAEQAHHRRIEDMLRRMHGRILFLVMRVKYGLFHSLLEFNGGSGCGDHEHAVVLAKDLIVYVDAHDGIGAQPGGTF